MAEIWIQYAATMRPLTDHEFIELVTRARDAYIADHPRKSLTTFAAVVLIDQFLDDVRTTQRREPATFLTRVRLEAQVTRLTEYGELGPRAQNTWNSIGVDVGRALQDFQHDVSAFSRRWRVRFLGPTGSFGVHAKPGKLAVKALVEDVDSLQAVVSDEMRIAAAADLVGVCLCCGTPYDYNLDYRLCTREGCDANASRPEYAGPGLYVSILPQRRDADYTAELPEHERDELFRVVDDIPRASRVEPNTGTPIGSEAPVSLRAVLPYTDDHLSNAGLALGIPLVYSWNRLSAHARFRDVSILDLSTYHWSNTLKDPKSWAAINVAISAGISKLALYTAGNAGMSLAKLAYSLSGVARSALRIFALVDPLTDREILTQLRMWGTTLVHLKANEGQRLIDPQTVWSMIAAETGLPVPERKDRWHVTDGWDGVGIVMYRLLFRELARRLRPQFVVLPIGTGSLFIGAHLGLRDAFGLDYATRLIGVVPSGKNILTPVNVAGSADNADVSALAPKLVGDYTPLRPCVTHIVKKHNAQIVQVSRDMQVDVLRYLGDSEGHIVAAEPSAVLAFAALRGDGRNDGVHEIARQMEAPTLAQTLRHFSESRVLVVNTGLGVVGRDEMDFVAKYQQA